MRGKLSCRSWDARRRAGFNEARAFCAGNSGIFKALPVNIIASMRPARFAREIVAGAMLQRHSPVASMRPARFAREIAPAGAARRPDTPRFNEARAFCAGNFI